MENSFSTLNVLTDNVGTLNTNPDPLLVENDIVLSSSESKSSLDDDNILNTISSGTVKYRITNVALSDLLRVLRYNHKCFNSFPFDARTILKTKPTNQSLEIRTLHPGLYRHFGFAKGITTLVGNNIVQYEKIKLLIGVDGLPLAKSSDSQFWPILRCIQNILHNFKSQIFLAGLYWGNKKPLNSNDFLIDLVNELKQLCTNGINLPCGNKKIVFHAFCCDIPAKSYILGTKGLSGFSSCTKYTTSGSYFERRVCFPETNFTKRTHEQFLNQTDEDFHGFETISALTEIPGVNMVQSFPNDCMHCLCLTVVKKVLLIW